MSAKKTTKTTATKKPAAKKASKAPARTKKPKLAGKLSALDAAASWTTPYSISREFVWRCAPDCGRGL